MVQFYDHIPDFLQSWILEQKIFWVATAPLTEDGHINLSPKGDYGTFHIVDENTVWYEDLTGSGVETISHIRENGRITVLFNAFDGPPKIARLFGKGVVYEFDTPEYNVLIPANKRRPGSRAVIMIQVYKVATSCGYAVPFFDYKGERTRLAEFSWYKEKYDNTAPPSSELSEPPNNGLKSYWKQNNVQSLDGLPGVLTAYKSHRQFEEPKDIVKSQVLPTNAGAPTTSMGTKNSNSRRILTTAAMVGSAFGVGVLLSAQVYNMVQRFGKFTVPR